MARRRRIIDAATGEITSLVVESSQTQQARWRTSTRDYGWVRMYQGGVLIDAITTEPRPTAVEFEVWLSLLEVLDYDQCAELNLSSLARRLGRSREAVSRALGRLIARRMVHRDPEFPRCYWLDPDLAWKGNPGERKRQQARLKSLPAS